MPERHASTGRPHRTAQALAVLACVLVAGASPASAQDTKPYDDRLMRLSEILGAVHYLRELCGADEGQLWRDRMRELIEAEGTTALRRAQLTRSFKDGNVGYSRSYRRQTASAEAADKHLLYRATDLATGLA